MQLEHRTLDTDVDFWVIELGELSVRCRVASWAESPENAFYLKESINREVLKLMRSLTLSPHHYKVSAPREDVSTPVHPVLHDTMSA